ncbi:hypothetical protein GQ43DRAFT_461069 [Delitschia confertaspora ATCC 74209]|uniref:Uncharacterized protein n=1 Tax=Delitschia confertaspora ATCC 74209 TaxID=1513339 RepID=A0A9P4JQU7_9PLEO|nr:hypothetical protein GQ43DRAFT_461069 [Delitschia confertaspora ATCC 74209]
MKLPSPTHIFPGGFKARLGVIGLLRKLGDFVVIGEFVVLLVFAALSLVALGPLKILWSPVNFGVQNPAYQSWATRRSVKRRKVTAQWEDGDKEPIIEDEYEYDEYEMTKTKATNTPMKIVLKTMIRERQMIRERTERMMPQLVV